MINTFLAVPSQAANGAGAAVDFGSVGVSKTVVISGTWNPTQQPTVNIEGSNDPAATAPWAPLGTTQGAGSFLISSACRWLRARVSNFKGGQAPVIAIGGPAEALGFVTLVAPADDGVGASVDISTLGEFKTAHIAEEFGGTTIVEMSTDGGTTWAQPFASQQQGIYNAPFTGNFARVKRTGVPVVNPGLPSVFLGGGNAVGGGGSGGLFEPDRELFVAKSWPVGVNPLVFFTTISAALLQAAALLPVAASPVNIEVSPGTYTENLTLVSNVAITGKAKSSVLLNGNATWLAGQGVNVSQVALAETVVLDYILFSNTANVLTYDTTAKSAGNAIMYLTECSLQGVTATGRANLLDNFFAYLPIFVKNSAVSFTNMTGAGAGVGVELVSGRVRQLTLVSSTVKIQGGETTFGGSATHALTGTASVKYQGLDLNIPISIATGCTMVASGCDILTTVTTAAGGAADVRGSDYNQNSNLTGAGTVNRSIWNGTTGATGAGANPIVLSPPYPDGTYNVQLQLVSGPGNVAVAIAAVSKTGAGFTITDAVGGNVWDYTVIHG